MKSVFLAMVVGCLVLQSSPTQAQESGEEAVQAMDYLTFSAGTIPVSVSGAGVELRTGIAQAVEAIDGSGIPRILNKKKGDHTTTDFEFVYALPASTTFDRFAVPNIGETPSPSQTFVREIQILGSSTGPDKDFEVLAEATLTTHTERNQVTEVPLTEAGKTASVRWVKLRLVGGIEEGAAFFEFSELIGEGTQESVPMVEHFTGIWNPKLGVIELKQDGPTVTGCADKGRKTVTGTVTGNVLRATFVDNTSGTTGAFVAVVDDNGGLWGLRSDNGAPFRLYDGARAAEGTTTPCSEVPPPTLGCDSVLHGIQFAYNSSKILPTSAPVLDALSEGLKAVDASTKVVIEGHTSSEGSDTYNQKLSEERAQAVVEALVTRGIDAKRIASIGRGESNPIASNDTEAGRSLNRRVEVLCPE